ncbi:hypothetical protein [Methylocella sp.]|uniref:hypothetical protein n=1 Tax=Methylocella sp. TaxID=1978226 RepID=UPI0035B200D1
MASRLFSSALALSLAVAAPSRAQEDEPVFPRPRPPADAEAPPSSWPGGLPDGWRALGDDEPPLRQNAPSLDFGRDSRFAPPGSLAPRKPAPKDEATLKAEREKAQAEALRKALEPKPDPAVLRAQALDVLFARLAATNDPAQAEPIVAAIQRIWTQPNSDTASLILQRAQAAVDARSYDAALALLDRLTAIAPDWAEAWSERAAVRMLAGDAEGAMGDIDRTIRLEPRQFDALANLGGLLEREGLESRALEAYEKSLRIYPAQPALKEAVEKLEVKVRGRDI